jgi:hypothetical protein
MVDDLLPEGVPAEGEGPPWLEGLLELIARQRAVIHDLREEVQALRDEVAVLRKQKPRPTIRPSQLTKGEKKKRRRRGSRKPGAPPRVDRSVVVRPDEVPAGSRFKGYNDFLVQELVIKAVTTRYRQERWRTPDGHEVTGQLPADAADGHFGATLRSFVLYQYYHAHVTEPLLLEQLREWGVRISAGQLHRLITEGKETFHREKDEILRVGLRVSGHVHADDTGARHRGKNGYTTHIGNEWFAWFQTTESKSRINFLELLRGPHTDYVLSGEALEYMAARNLARPALEKLSGMSGQVFADGDSWEKALKEWGITQDLHVQIATEGALLGAVLEHGVSRDLAIVSDDAGQFNILRHALCWIHAERLLAKLVGYRATERRALDEVRAAVWSLYQDLKAYRDAPTADAKQELDKRFDALCETRTCFIALNQALDRMKRNKAELLLVLERPSLPLHNNLSEGDIREYVKRRKMSGGTRSENGRRGRDTFASLKKTCRKLRISFWSYLKDRLCGAGEIPALPCLIEARALSP